MAWKGRKRTAEVDFAPLLIQLVAAKLQIKNDALYKTLEGLINKSQQAEQQTTSIFNSFFGDIVITDDVDLSAILQAINDIRNSSFWTENFEPGLPFSRQVIPGLNITFDYSVPNQVTINVSGVAASDADYLTWSNESATLPNSRNLKAGTNVTFDDSVANERTVSVSGSASGGAQLHGLQRVLGDGATTTFNLLDFAEYLEHVGVNGSFRDPSLFSLSADRSQIIFSSAPAAGEVIAIEYVTATL